VAAAAATEARLREQANALFNFISTAHEELSDKLKRRKVDQLLEVEADPEDLLSSYKSSPSSYGRSANGGYGARKGSGAAGYAGYGNTRPDPFFCAGGYGGAGRARATSGGGAAGYGGGGQHGGTGRARQGAGASRPSYAWWGDAADSDESDTDDFGH
jgi:curved DNA-binding protein CbpA